MAVEIRGRVEGLRAELEAAKAERDSVAALPATPEEVAANVEGWISAKAAEWAPAIGAFTRPGGGAVGDFTLSLPIGGGHMVTSGTESQREAALCALFPDRIRDVLLERCEKHLTEHGSGLPLAERIERLAILDKRIAELEAREEGLILEAEADGIEIDRRPDADVFAVFGIEVTEHAEAVQDGAPAKPVARRQRRAPAESAEEFGPEAA